MAGYTERWVVNNGVSRITHTVEWRGEPVSSTLRPRSFSVASIRTAVRPSNWKVRPLLQLTVDKRLG